MAIRTRVARGGVLPEAAGAFLLGMLLAVLTRRPQDLSTTVPLDAGDPVLQTWVLAWPAHALRNGLPLFDANAFAPLQNSFAFTDLMLGYLPLGLVGQGPEAAVVRYNVALLIATALAFAGTWLLVRQLGLGRAAALVAAVFFAVNPWRVSQLGHLQVLSTGGIPLALAMLARGHGLGLRAGRGPVRPGWALAGWATATWQVSIGFGIGIQLAYLLGILTAVAGVRALLTVRRGGGWPSRGLLAADGAGLVLFLGVSAVLALPYFAVVEDHPSSRRSVADLELFSPTASSLLTAPPESLLWGRVTEDRRQDVIAVNEKELLPGAVVVVLAVAGLWPGAWSRRRVVLLTGSVVVLTVFALGTNGPAGGRFSYLLLFDHAPGWQGIRTPGRLVTLAWLGLALLAAHGVTVLRRAAWPRPTPGERPAALALGLGLSALVLLEGLDTAALAPVPPAPSVRLADLPGPVMVLPSESGTDQHVMRWSTDGFPKIVNGISGFTPQLTEDLRSAASLLPAPEALQRLRGAGVRTLVVLPQSLPGTRYEGLDAGVLAALPGVTVEQRADALVVTI